MFKNNNTQNTILATNKTNALPALLFVKPFALATLAALVMPLVIAFVFSLVSDAFLNHRQTATHATTPSPYGFQTQPKQGALAATATAGIVH